MSSTWTETELELPAHSSSRALVVFEGSANGAAAIRQAAELVRTTGTALVVVTLAGQDPVKRCCGPSPHAYNCAVRDAARDELDKARALLAALVTPATLRVLIGEPEPDLAAWAGDQGFDLVFLPRHRLMPGGHPAVRKLRRCTAAEVRLVG